MENLDPEEAKQVQSFMDDLKRNRKPRQQQVLQPLLPQGNMPPSYHRGEPMDSDQSEEPRFMPVQHGRHWRPSSRHSGNRQSPSFRIPKKEAYYKKSHYQSQDTASRQAAPAFNRRPVAQQNQRPRYQGQTREASSRVFIDSRTKIPVSNLPDGFSCTETEIKCGDVIFSIRKRFENKCHSPVMHSTLPMAIVPSLRNLTMPKPTDPEVPRLLLNNCEFFLQPEIRRAKTHANGGQNCMCTALLMTETFHRVSVLPEVCIKNSLSEAEDYSVLSSYNSPTQVFENASRFYVADSTQGAHTLAVPGPFMISGRWPLKSYLPPYALISGNSILSFYYKLMDTERFREVASIYQTEPQAWDPRNHPLWDEPTAEDELCRYTEQLYGLETLFRTALVVHPTKERKARMYVATDSDYLTPVLNTEGDQFIIDRFISDVMKPFYQGGYGRATCPVCIVNISHGIYHPVRMTRSEFIMHYRQIHHRNSVVTGLFTSTQYGLRMYQANALYFLCLPQEHLMDTDPACSPMDLEALRKYDVSWDMTVLKFLDERYYQAAPHHPAPTDQERNSLPPAPLLSESNSTQVLRCLSEIDEVMRGEPPESRPASQSRLPGPSTAANESTDELIRSLQLSVGNFPPIEKNQPLPLAGGQYLASKKTRGNK
jgi:hypothetical protein